METKKSASEKNLLSSIESAREVAGNFEALTKEWEEAMEAVRGLVDLHIKLYPVVWSDKEWKEMMSR